MLEVINALEVQKPRKPPPKWEIEKVIWSEEVDEEELCDKCPNIAKGLYQDKKS